MLHIIRFTCVVVATSYSVSNNVIVPIEPRAGFVDELAGLLDDTGLLDETGFEDVLWGLLDDTGLLLLEDDDDDDDELLEDDELCELDETVVLFVLELLELEELSGFGSSLS